MKSVMVCHLELTPEPVEITYAIGTYTGTCGDSVCHLELTPEPVEITYVIWNLNTGTCGDSVCHLELKHRNLWR